MPGGVSRNASDGRAPLIFLGHANVDAAIAKALNERLLAAPHAESLELCFDKDDLVAGQNCQAAIARSAAIFSIEALLVGACRLFPNDPLEERKAGTSSSGTKSPRVPASRKPMPKGPSSCNQFC